jgi:cystathionine beta-lyase
MTTMPNFEDLSVDELRKRRSAKWTMFPADVLPAWVAEMDFPLDDVVRAALLASIEDSDCGYANGAGVKPAFAAFVQSRYGWTLDPAGVFVIPDVLVGISEILRTLNQPGDRIVVNSPVYPPFYRVVGEVERAIEDVPLLRGAGGSWSLDFAGLERAFAGGAAAYLLCSPHNPLGMVFDAPTLTRIAELAKKYNVLVIADEIHAPLTMNGATFVPFLPIGDLVDCDAVALASASKAWNLPGLKCAVAVAGSERMRKQLARRAARAARSQPPAAHGAARARAARRALHRAAGELSCLARLQRARPRSGSGRRLPRTRARRAHARPRLRPGERSVRARQHGYIERHPHRSRAPHGGVRRLDR